MPFIEATRSTAHDGSVHVHFTALCEHYDGEIPDYVEFSSVILEIAEDGEVEVIRPRSYCDLYRIERAAAEADE